MQHQVMVMAVKYTWFMRTGGILYSPGIECDGPHTLIEEQGGKANCYDE